MVSISEKRTDQALGFNILYNKTSISLYQL